MTTMIWIPTKPEIERLLFKAYLKVSGAKRIADIASELEDEIGALSCHIANRALEDVRGKEAE